MLRKKCGDCGIYKKLLVVDMPQCQKHNGFRNSWVVM